MPADSSRQFTRDRFTWLAYVMLAYYAYLQASLGPLMPFLRDELDLSYTVGGLHFSAFALGMTLAGLTTDRLAARFGRPPIFWGGGLGMGVGALCFILARAAPLTIASAWLMGLTGTFLLIMIQATLSDRHQEQRAIGLTESNIAASVAAGLAPLAVGTFERISVGWRAALVLGAAVGGLVFAARRRTPIPATASRKSDVAARSRQPLPTIFWAYWLVIFVGTSAEWSIIFWGAEFLKENVGLSSTDASTTMSVFFLAMVIGRFTGSRLTRSVNLLTLLLVAATIAAVGFFPFWLAAVPAINIIGLFVAGLGVANLFPLTLSAASGVVSTLQSDTASGRVSLGTGMAILIMPQVLGFVADQTSIGAAYTIVAGLLMLVVAIVVWTTRLPRPVPVVS